MLDKAGQAYYGKNNKFPVKLKTLVDDKIVEAKSIIDPWDREHQ